METPKPLKHFPKIREARELLLAQAEELIHLKLKIAKEALEAKDYETADEAVNWLLEHMPADQGVTVIEASIDKPKQIVSGPSIPAINIGFALGGIQSTQKTLPEVVEVKSEEE